MVDVELSSIQREVSLVLSHVSLVWGLEADEGMRVGFTFLGFENSARFDLTELTENLSKVLLSLIFESLDVQVTSLLGSLVFQSLVLEHLCAFCFF